MMHFTDTLDVRTLDDAVEEFARATRFPVAFAGLEADGAATVTAIAGNRTQSLYGLRVELGRGLGGRAMAESRPRLTGDYEHSSHITHDYDTQVLGEGIVSLFAMPVILDGIPRAVLYGGTRGGRGPGTAFVQAAASISTDLANEIRIQDEVARRVSQARSRDHESAALSGPTLEMLRGAHAELRAIAAETADDALRLRLTSLERRLAAVGSTMGGPGTADTVSAAGDCPSFPEPSIRLTPREVDVLSHAALGRTNSEIGAALNLTEATVKSYMKTAMAKLDVSTRHAAVATARMLGLIR